MSFLKPFFCLIIYLLLSNATVGFAQVLVKGTVYDISQRIPLDGVTVLSHLGKAATTDSFGHYTINLSPNDSIYFSYLNKPTKKVAVKDITYPYAFDMSLHVVSGLLPTVFVRPKNYRTDSAQNRNDYAKVFDFQKPNPLKHINVGGGTVGIDPNELINVFRFKRNRRILAFQTRLVQQEQDKYIDHRFNKGIVKKLTGLQSPALDTFMLRYRPNYYFVTTQNDIDLYYYIQQAAQQFKILWRNLVAAQ